MSDKQDNEYLNAENDTSHKTDCPTTTDLHYFFEHSLDMLCIMDRDGYFVRANPAFEKILGWQSDALLAKPLVDFVHPDDVLTTARQLEKLSQGLQMTDFETRCSSENGSYKWVAWHIEVTPEGRLYASAHDISQAKRLETRLAKQAMAWQVVAKISTAVATISNSQQMLQRVVDLTKEGFNLYHAHIYLFDQTDETLVLTAGAGEIGEQMVAARWQIPLETEQALVARAARTRQGIMANDIRKQPDHLPHPLLPNARSEMAIPMTVGDELLGVLDMQSDQVDYFSDEDIPIKTILVTQVATTLQNIQSRDRSEQTLKELDTLTRRLTHVGWEAYLDEQTASKVGYVYDLHQLLPFQDDGPAIEALGEVETTLTQPLILQDEPIGHLTLADPQILTDEATEIMSAVAGRLGAHIENLRLTEQTQAALAETEKQADRLILLNEMGADLNQAASVDEIFNIVLAGATQIIAGDRVSLALFNVVEDIVEIIAFEGEASALPERTSLPLQGTDFERVIQEKRLIIEQDNQDNTLLPEISSRMNAPLIAGGEVIGSLNVGSKRPNAYTISDQNLFLQIASLLSSNLESRRLFEQMQQALAQAEATQRRYTVQAWESYRASHDMIGHEQVREGVTPLGDHLPDAVAQAVTQKKTTLVNKATGLVGRAELETHGQPTQETELESLEISAAKSGLIIPLTIRDEVVGVLGLEEINETREWTPEEIALVEVIVAQLSEAAENLRLIDETQQRAARERRVNEIGDRIQAAQSLEEALQIAVKEVGLSLQAPQTVVRLETNR